MKDLADYVNDHYPQIGIELPDKITFIDSQDLEDQYPDCTSKERERLAAKEYGAIFVKRIGGKLRSGKPHDGRAPDYDDWQLNGDLMYWFEPLQMALEISSMGIRVSEESMLAQLEQVNCQYRKKLPYHKMLLAGELPYSIGGGIGQSRLCMLLLGRVHVGEVQASIWPDEMREKCAENGIVLL